MKLHQALLIAAIALLPQIANAAQFTDGALMVTHDPVTLSVGTGGCASGSECNLGSVTFSLSEQWLNTNYSCYANQPPGSTVISGAIFEFYPQTTSSMKVQFVNPTSGNIGGGTNVTLAVTCVGQPATNRVHRRYP